MKLETDTIAAIATAAGRSGIGVIRISGPKVKTIAKNILNHCPKPRVATHTDFKDDHNNILDNGLALYFPTPNSFTGEDVLELQGHGSPVVLDNLLAHIIKLGARLAKPGEFSRRAFLNNKIDLTQAEAIADLIDAASNRAAQSALHSLQGNFSRLISDLVKQLILLRTHVEAAIDFPDEDIDFLSDPKIKSQAQTLINNLKNILNQTRQGVVLKEGVKLVIIGKPNVGKSSLLNALSGQASAIVTPQAGTTRDILKETILINGIPVQIHDTAGLHQTDDIIEQEGIRRAQATLEKAEHVLVLIDAQEDLDSWQTLLSNLSTPINNKNITIVINKIDLLNLSPHIDSSEQPSKVYLSAKTQAGLSLLSDHLAERFGLASQTEGLFTARRRHLEALNNALAAIEAGFAQLNNQQAGELFAEDLRQAQQFLGEITGEFHSDDLLGEIFSSFCIGK